MSGSRRFLTAFSARRWRSFLKPQTTRNRILGVRTVEGGQFIFFDTPGIHEGVSTLNRRMVKAAIATAQDADVLLLLVEASSPALEKDRKMIQSFRGNQGISFLVINKIDLVKKTTLLPMIEAYQALQPFREIIPVLPRRERDWIVCSK